jgi:hypothetical protein
MEEEMTGDELRKLIANIEETHGADVDFHVGRLWAMRGRLIAVRVLENELRYPKSLKTLPRDVLKKNSETRKTAMYEMSQGGMTYKEIAGKFGISKGRVGQIVLRHKWKLERQQRMGVSQ